jgi:predicted nucleic acid-binding protein
MAVPHAVLAAFARQHNYELVTFDRGFRIWKHLTLTVLSHATV